MSAAPRTELAARPVGRGGEQSRAVYPDAEGFAERDGLEPDGAARAARQLAELL